MDVSLVGAAGLLIDRVHLHVPQGSVNLKLHRAAVLVYPPYSLPPPSYNYNGQISRRRSYHRQ